MRKQQPVDLGRTSAAGVVMAHAAGETESLSEADMKAAIETLSPENRWEQVISSYEWNDFVSYYRQRTNGMTGAAA